LPEWCMNLNIAYQTEFDFAYPFKYYKYIKLSIII